MIIYIKIYFNLAILFLLLTPSHSTSQWITGSIDTLTHDNSTDFVNPPNSIAVDIDNTIYVVWKNGGVLPSDNISKVFFSYKTVNGKWSEPETISDSSKISGDPSIVASKKTRKIYAVYVEQNNINSNSEIILAEKNEGNSWSKINISNDSLQDRIPSLELDSLEKLHITWVQYKSGINVIKYTNNVSGNWKTSTLIDNFMGDNYYARPSFAVSSKGIAHIIYISLFQNGFKNIHVENSVPGGDKWKYELLPESINGAGILRIDKSGTLHYIYNYSKGFQGQMKVLYTYKQNKEKEWTNPEAINSMFDGACSSFEIGEDNKLYLSIDSLTNWFTVGISYLVTNKSGAWNFYPAINSGNTYLTNLKIDNNGIGHMVSQISKSVEKGYEIVHYESSNNIVNISSNQSNIFSNFELLQNYPNPFNSSTKISLRISKKEFVKLNVFDILGRKVKNILSAILNQGTYDFIFNASDLESGIYFYKLEVDENSITKKMLYLK